MKIGLRIIAPRDSGLIRNNDQVVSEFHRGPAERKDPIDKPNLFRSMQIPHLFIYDPVPVEE
jgi:hypothetical protein